MTTSDPLLPKAATLEPGPSSSKHDTGGSGDDFDAFFADNYAATVRLAHLLTGSNATAEDLAQDAFARVLPKIDGLTNPAGYLRTVTVNICRNHHRSASREADRFRRHGVSEIESTLQSNELLGSIRKLPYRQQAVLVLRYWLDLTEAEIARSLGCKPGTVKSLNSRALNALQNDIDKDLA